MSHILFFLSNIEFVIFYYLNYIFSLHYILFFFYLTFPLKSYIYISYCAHFNPIPPGQFKYFWFWFHDVAYFNKIDLSNALETSNDKELQSTKDIKSRHYNNSLQMISLSVSVPRASAAIDLAAFVFLEHMPSYSLRGRPLNSFQLDRWKDIDWTSITIIWKRKRTSNASF